ncbi:MAG: FliG C-terminal domain-containing protein, partial [Phycisphaerae bacterium]
MAEGLRKAALFLRCLDPVTAGQLLKSAPPEAIKKIAAELAYLDASGVSVQEEAAKQAREFFTVLHQQKSKQNLAFLQTMLAQAMGERESSHILANLEELLDSKDPFLPVRNADVQRIAEALQGEPPQVAAMIMSELSPEKSSLLLPLLEEDVQTEAVRGMTLAAEASWTVKLRVARKVRERMAGEDGPKAAPRDEKLRKVAVLLRGLKQTQRDEMLKGIAEKDEETAQLVEKLMVIWEDLPHIADRSMQEILRGVDSRKLALALWEGDEDVVERLRGNMSERASAMLDEETSLLSNPKDEEIEEAREVILDSLRDLNKRGDLEFVEEELT